YPHLLILFMCIASHPIYILCLHDALPISEKQDVHNAIKTIDKGLFPKAFCKIIPDYLTGDKDSCVVMHDDGAGTKSALAYMYWRSEEHTSELQSRFDLVCRLLLEKKNDNK